ncbi:putative nucleolar protein [Trypanosoma conorhini]|uniref:Putative nucleolar protein n=1 Tax=Trypanosoma conorhini TaxID=83891 RepID=A0A422PKZ7_9TRYP|nr:putative nucleolar protein [Trypanosoma conorhini]RNF18387.1 putative nucleolar protein [Trypanosoma conorhini]
MGAKKKTTGRAAGKKQAAEPEVARAPTPSDEASLHDEEAIEFDDVLPDDHRAAAAAAADDGDDEAIHDDDDFEVKAEKYRRRMLALSREAAEEREAEMRTRAVRSTPLHDAEEAAEQMQLLGQRHTTEELRDRVQETVRVLSKFKDEREEERTRAEYMELLRSDLMELYEYNEFLTDAILLLFPPAEAVEFFEAMEKPRPTTIRVNTLKAKRRDLAQTLVKRGMNVEPLEKWSKVGLQVFESNVPIAGTIEYLAGHYMLQSAVSFLPVMALAPQEQERILDMAAAPGGKTTYIAQLMKNTGVLFANDVSEPRTKSLNANLQRLGVTNAVVTNYDGVGYDKVMKNFDRVLLDAPCTGSGIISRDKSIKTSKHYEDVQRASQQQRSLLLSAIDAAKVGGYVVYSTCSFLVEENEAVVEFAVRRRHVEIVEMGLPFGRPGLTKYRHHRFHEKMQCSRRFFPHVHNMDGFFVCKLKKLSGERAEVHDAKEEAEGKRNGVSGRGKSGKKMPSKRPRDSSADAVAKAPPKASRLSIPPAKQRSGKATKPRNA